MLQAALQTDKGPIGIVGINYEHLRRLQAGMSLDIDIKKITPPGQRMLRVIIHYAHTYEQVVDDMKEGDIPIPDAFRKLAREMDEQEKRERRGG